MYLLHYYVGITNVRILNSIKLILIYITIATYYNIMLGRYRQYIIYARTSSIYYIRCIYKYIRFDFITNDCAILLKFSLKLIFVHLCFISDIKRSSKQKYSKLHNILDLLLYRNGLYLFFQNAI